MRALVTGACGFVGGYLTRHLIERGDETCATFFALTPNGLPCATAQLDVSDSEQCREVIRSFAPEAVYHLAGMAFPPDAERNFANALSINVGGTFNVLDACSRLPNPPRVVIVSSAQVYGRCAPQSLPLREEAPLRPYDNYSLSKILAEQCVSRFTSEGKLCAVIMRPFNHIGAGQRPEFAVSNFALQLAEIAAGKREPVLRVGNLAAKRDFTDVRDIVTAYRLAATAGSGVYNLCSGDAVEMQEILNRLISISGLSVTLETDPSRMRASDTPILYGSAAKAEKELGWKRNFTLDASLRAVYQHWFDTLRSTPT